MSSQYYGVYDEDHKDFQYPEKILALCTYTELMESLGVNEDMRRVARHHLSNCSGNSVGSYTDMAGLDHIREEIGDYIAERDGIPMERYEEILIENRQEDLLNLILPIFPGYNECGTHGMMVPAPFSPSIPEVIECCQFKTFPYYLLENKGRWTITEEILVEALDRSKCNIQCLFVENPGYPTGHLYNRTELETFVKFAKKYRLVMIASENLQLDVYEGENTAAFLSMRKVLLEMGSGYTDVQLISMFSPNRSALGQRGHSVCYLDSVGMDGIILELGIRSFNTPLSLSQIYLSLFLGPNYIRNDSSYKEYYMARKELKQQLSKLSTTATSFLNKLQYVSCCPSKAGQTVYPRIDFPNDWHHKIKKEEGDNLEDVYCRRLEQATSIHVTSGNVFGQRPGPFHFKFNIPFEEEELLNNLEKIKEFHDIFCKKKCKSKC